MLQQSLIVVGDERDALLLRRRQFLAAFCLTQYCWQRKYSQIISFQLKFYYLNNNKHALTNGFIMTMMTVKEVAAFLEVQEVRVERLERESLLIAKDRDVDGQPLFSKEDVEKYKVLADRLGGI